MARIAVRTEAFGDPELPRYLMLEESGARLVEATVEYGFDSLLFWHEDERFALESHDGWYLVTETNALEILIEWGFGPDSDEWEVTDADTWIVERLENYIESNEA